MPLPRNRALASLFAFMLACSAMGQEGGRQQSSIDDNWKFLPDGAAYAETVAFNDAGWQTVSLPHSWNAFDPFDDDHTYRRGIGWYRRELRIAPANKDKKIYIYFEGANQVTYIYVNGYFAGVHKGGYTGFSVDVTPYLNWKGDGRNVVAVQVSNAHDPFVPPLNVGYASYGGIYRDAWTIITGNVHFSTIDNNAGGVYITTPNVSNESAGIHFKTTIRNESGSAQNVQFTNTIIDASGKDVASLSRTARMEAAGEAVLSDSTTILRPHLWSPEAPYLYRVISRILVDGKVMDETESRTGFRWFSFDDEGFHLNGHKYILHGTNRHQDMKGKGDALSPEDHRRDMQLIKDMGCNFVRLAHYPQAAAVLRLADELGLLIWEETPVVNFVTPRPEFLTNAQTMIHEMITQGYNHPSVIMWGSSNEIFLHGPDGERIGRQDNAAYAYAVKNIARSLDSTVRAEDPHRYSTMAMHISGDYAKYGLDTITQVSGYNIYSGWYSGKVEDFGNDLDIRHKPGRHLFVSEYGAEGEVRLNTETPTRMDYTGQYQRYYHEGYLRQINKRPWLAGTAIWNQFDFSQPNIGGPAPHMNQKGLSTWDRHNKDVYYFYKANWNPEPMVYIASRDWAVRAGARDQPSTIDVYSNGKEVSLTVNGKSIGTKKPNDINKVSWQVQLQDGANEITASAKTGTRIYTDHLTIGYKAYDADLRGQQSIAINTGSNAQYLDAAGLVWIEDRPYHAGSFGYTGGTPKAFDRKDVIMNTDDEPMYYSYLDSIQSYRFDVADGRYRLTFCFAEAQRIGRGERVFDVVVNGETVVSGLDLAATAGFAQAVVKTIVTTARNGGGVQVRFVAAKGNPVLNGIRLERY